MEVEFKYNFSDNYLKFKLIEEKNEVWMDEVNLDYQQAKIFFLLLRNAVDKFLNDGYKTFVQTILKDEWDIIKNLNWKIKENKSTSPLLIIECDLDKAIENIGKALGYSD
jgi:hypothetical protein